MITYATATLATPAKLAATAALAATHPQRLFDMTPIIHPQGGVPDPASRTFWSATANALYLVREDGEDMFGPTPGFAAKLQNCPDLGDHGRRGPIGCDADPVKGLELWRAADLAARHDRPRLPAAFHAIGWLPVKLDEAGWREIVLEFLDDQIVRNGMIADWSIHRLADGEGGWIKRPHMHAVITSRFWRKDRKQGEPQPAWFPTVKRRLAAGDVWQMLVEREVARAVGVA